MDDLTVVCKAWCSFKNLTKKDTDIMDQYLHAYEKKVMAMAMVMAMQLTDSAVLVKKDKQIVLTAIDYKKKAETHDHRKNA